MPWPPRTAVTLKETHSLTTLLPHLETDVLTSVDNLYLMSQRKRFWSSNGNHLRLVHDNSWFQRLK